MEWRRNEWIVERGSGVLWTESFVKMVSIKTQRGKVQGQNQRRWLQGQGVESEMVRNISRNISRYRETSGIFIFFLNWVGILSCMKVIFFINSLFRIAASVWNFLLQRMLERYQYPHGWLWAASVFATQSKLPEVFKSFCLSYRWQDSDKRLILLSRLSLQSNNTNDFE